jgi:hypothetical protein
MSIEGIKHWRNSFTRLLYFILLAAVATWGLSHSLSRWMLAILPILWGACPPRSFQLPKSSYRLVRLIIALVLVYFISIFLLWAVYEWDRNTWKFPSAVVLTLAAFAASSRFRRWAELPEKRFSSIEEVIRLEAGWLQERRSALGLSPISIPAVDPTDGSDIVGLALSGGGIRSATVCLGFVSEMTKLGLFKYFDYLSTVSGGGWLGSAITAMAAKQAPGNNRGPLDSPECGQLYRTFREGRVYIGAAKVLRALAVMLFGTVSSLATATLFLGGLIIILLWLSTFSMVDWMTPGANPLLEADYFIRNNIGPRWLYHAPRADNLIEFLWPIRLFPSLIVVSAAILCGAAILKIASLKFKTRSGEFQRLSDVSLLLSSRLFIVVTILVSAFQGRSVITALLFGLVAVILLSLIGRPKTRARFGLLGALAATSPWLVDLIAPGWQVVDKVTSYWYYLFLQVIFLPYNLLQLLTFKAYAIVEFAGLAPPGFSFADPTAYDLAFENILLLFFGSGLLSWLGFLLFGYLFQRNRTGLHSFWRTQIDHAFLAPLAGGLSQLPLSQLRPAGGGESEDLFPPISHGPENGAPLQIINGAVNLPGSANMEVRRRAVARFEMTPYCVGGPATGWVETRAYGERITLASAAAISSAAVNPQSGHKIPGSVNWLLLLANFRLGVWLPNPRLANDRRRFHRSRAFAPLDIIKELLGTNSEEDSFVFVSDGGHGDNLGLVSLVERGCRLIVSVDAAGDPRWQFSDLEYALSLLREKGWAVTNCYYESIRPQSEVAGFSRPISETPMGRIQLTNTTTNITVSILLLKSCLTKETIEAFTEGSLRYAEQHPKFPQESTADQWFSEDQFDSYYAVGTSMANYIRDASFSSLVERPRRL